MGKQKNTTLDGEATSIKDMEVKKGTKEAPLHVNCFRCEGKKTSLVLARWTTSEGVKELCQGCAGLVHQMAVGSGGGGGDRATVQAAKRREAPAGCCSTCGAANVLVAAGVGHATCVAAWLDAGASVEFGGRKKIERPLHKACGNGHLAAAELLVDRGADVEARDKAKKTALYRAAEGGKDAVVAMLLRRGARSDAPASNAEDTPLAAATKALKAKRRKSTKEDEIAKAAGAARARARVVALLDGSESPDAAPEKAPSLKKKNKKHKKGRATDVAAPPAKKVKSS